MFLTHVLSYASFTFSGTILTQTGTDANISGLASISGAAGTYTSYTDGANTYRMFVFNPNIRLQINGTLTIDANTDILIFPHSGNYFKWMDIGATGKLITKDTSTDGTITKAYQKLSIRSMARTADHFSPGQGVDIQNGGQLEMDGGGIYTNSHINFLGSNSKLTVLKPSLVRLGTAVNGNKNILRIGTSEAQVSIDGLILHESSSGMSTAHISKLDNYSPQFCAEGILRHSGPTSGQVTLNSYNPIGCNMDFAFVGFGSFYTVYGYADKPVTASVHYDHPNVLSDSWLKIRKKLEIETLDDNNNPIQGVLSVLKDTNHGNRYNIKEDLTADIAYAKTSAANGKATHDILLANVQVAAYDNVGKHSPPRVVDYRTKNNSHDYKMDVHLWSYGFGYKKLTDVDLRGLDQTNRISAPLILDLNISETNKSTVDAYAVIDNLDKLYDRAKSWKADAANLEYPTIEALLISNEGSTLDLGNHDLVIDSNASTAFAVDKVNKKITIKATALVAGSRFGAIKTTGTLSTSNGAILELGYQDSTGINKFVHLDWGDNVTQEISIENLDTNSAIVSGSSATKIYKGHFLMPNPAPSAGIQVQINTPSGFRTYQEIFPEKDLSFVRTNITLTASEARQIEMLFLTRKLLQKTEAINGALTGTTPVITDNSTVTASKAVATNENQVAILQLLRRITRKVSANREALQKKQ